MYITLKPNSRRENPLYLSLAEMTQPLRRIYDAVERAAYGIAENIGYRFLPYQPAYEGCEIQGSSNGGLVLNKRRPVNTNPRKEQGGGQKSRRKHKTTERQTRHRKRNRPSRK